MLKIAVLDDDKTELENILSLLNDFKQAYPQYPFTVRAYGEPFTLLATTDLNGGYDVYLLDVVMPGMSGIDSAKELRRRGDRGEIVFLTVSTEYGADAFEVDALNYLIKPIKCAALFKCLIKAFEKIENRPAAVVKLAGGEIRKIFANEIVCVESFSHCQEVRLASGEILKSTMTLADFKTQLASSGLFYSPHRAYLINLDYVKGISAKGINAGGYLVPVPRGTLKAAQQVYLDYLLRK